MILPGRPACSQAFSAAMAALVVLNIPLLYFLNKDWYATLMNTIPGKAVLVVCAAAIFISFAKVVKLTQPIEYRR